MYTSQIDRARRNAEHYYCIIYEQQFKRPSDRHILYIHVRMHAIFIPTHIGAHT